MKEILLRRVLGGVTTERRTSSNVFEEKTIPLSSGLVKWSKLLADLEEVASASEAERVIKQNGFEVNGQAVTDPAARINVDQPASYEVRVGKKKFLRITLE